MNCRTPYATALLTLCCSIPALAQPPLAVLTGQVVQAASYRPIAGAQVVLFPGNASLVAITDSLGQYRIAGIPVGHYGLRIAALGFDTLEVPELWLRAGKQSVQRAELTTAAHELGSVRISATAREQLSPLGMRPFTVEQSLRWPATFYDPARLVAALPGVASVNDQANHLSIRGNSPNTNAWTLEGVEIVNPSHTANAGTASDLPTLSGGGVNILSAQMLATSQLLTGVLPADRDNALGVILDMRLRNGNMNQQEWTLQAGLLGIDVSNEGPIGKAGRASYLANYRYSTVGLLGAMGVDLGDEAIAFQDLSFHVTMPAGKRGEAHFFGMGGNSSNTFEALHDTTQWKVDKDSRNINYRSSMGAVGGNLRISLGRRSTLVSTVAVSEIDQDRTEDRLRGDYSVAGHSAAALSERKISGMAQLEGAVGGRFRYKAGASATERRLTSWLNSDVYGWLLRPWINASWKLAEHWQASAGVAAAIFTFTGETVAEPRASLEWQLPHGQAIALAAGIRSQLPQWQSFSTGGWPLFMQPAIGLTRSQDVVLGYDRPIANHFNLHAEVYHQHLSEVPVQIPGITVGQVPLFSMVNTWDEPAGIPLQPTGTADNTGLELSLDRHFAGNHYIQVNGSWYTSRYTDAVGREHDTRWNGQYLINLFGGKEFKKMKEDHVRTWGISGRVNLMGGAWTPPLPVYTNQNGTVMYGGNPDWQQLPAYYRIDLRVYLKKDKQGKKRLEPARRGRTGMWALDLQNLSGAQNAAYRYFDVRKNEVVTKYQLGLIPNLSYRIEF